MVDYAPRGFRTATDCGAFYDARARMFGRDEMATLEYSGVPAQQGLFVRATEALEPYGRVLDLGCGLGHLIEFFDEQGLSYASYHGIDVSRAMIERAVKRHGHRSNASFEFRDVVRDPLEQETSDVGYIISVLGYPIGKDPMAAMMAILRNAFLACTDGIAFTHLVKGRKEKLVFTTVPEELASRCERELGAKAEIHDDGSFTSLIVLRH